MSRKDVIFHLRRKVEWLDRRLAEMVPGTAKHNSMRAERVACDVAARELEARASVREVAHVIRRVADGLRYAPANVSPHDTALLSAWAMVVLEDEAQAKRDEAAMHGGGRR